VATYGLYIRNSGYERPDDLIVVRDRFSLMAALVPVLWALWHRHWWAALGYFVLSLLVTGLLMAFPMGAAAETIALLGICILQGLTAADVRHWSLMQTGFNLAAWGDAPDEQAAVRSLLHDNPDLGDDMFFDLSRPPRRWLAP